MEIPCDNCGIKFKKCKSHALRAKRNFCSKNCWQTHDKSFNKNFFNIIDNEEKAYWLGMICADGWLDARDKCLGLGLKRSDKTHVAKFAKIFKVLVHDYKNNKYSRCMIYSKTIFKDLINKGVVPKKSLKDNCEVFKHIPKNLTNHFVRGWFDGDGSINSSMSIVGTYNAIKTLTSLIKKGANLKSKAKPAKHKKIYRIQIGGKLQLKKIYQWMYKNSNIFLKRKYIKFNAETNH